jgi:hypothetical protein
MTDAVSPAEHAAAIAGARDRLLGFATSCSDDDWLARPLAGQGDDRTVGVIVDHVADACDYIGAWLTAIVDGQEPQVGPELIDSYNAAHARDAVAVTQADAAAHLQRSGDVIIALVSGLSPGDLERSAGRVGRLAQILARHPDDHRAQIEAALRG